MALVEEQVEVADNEYIDLNKRTLNSYWFDAIKCNDVNYVILCLPSIANYLELQSPENGWTALLIAINNCSIEIVNILLQNNANVNFIDNGDRTPLMHAMSLTHANKVAIVRLLLEYGADISFCQRMRDKSLSLLHILVVSEYEKNDEVASMLIEAGIDVNIPNLRGAIPVMDCKDHRILSLLLIHGADVNYVDNVGHTVFMHIMVPGVTIDMIVVISSRFPLVGLFYSEQHSFFSVVLINMLRSTRLDGHELRMLFGASLIPMEGVELDLSDPNLRSWFRCILPHCVLSSTDYFIVERLIMAASYYDTAQILTELLPHSLTDVNAQDEHGHTALRYAAMNGSFYASNILMNCGALVFTSKY